MTASCFGIWILIGPAEASTWGGLQAVIGYACGQSFVFLYFFYKRLELKFENYFQVQRSLTEVISKRYSVKVCKLVLGLTLLYLYVYFCAEVTAIAKVTNLILGTPLWLTAGLIIFNFNLFTKRWPKNIDYYRQISVLNNYYIFNNDILYIHK